MVAILGYSRNQITSAVQAMYTVVARTPDAPFHFPVGASACRRLGYSDHDIRQVPDAVLNSFAGVGCPFRAAAIKRGDATLDLGAGSGVDTVIAYQHVGPDGRVIALDLTSAMSRKLFETVTHHSLNIDVIQGSAEQLPLASEQLDSVTTNGALNLVPDKRLAIREIFRVLRPGGRLQCADVVIQQPVTVNCDSDPRLWVECVVGATVEENLVAMLGDAGFEDIQVVNRHDYFALSPSAQTREIAAGYGAQSIELFARRGLQQPSRMWQWVRRCDPRRWLTALRQRGILGIAALLLALLSCYGALLAVAILSILGINLVLNPAVWAGTIAVFTLVAGAAIVRGRKRHGGIGPTLMSVVAVGLLFFSLFVHYWWVSELVAFMLLLGATLWDIVLRRCIEAQHLGLRD